jgi:Na+-driven multidrug efflux pump
MLTIALVEVPSAIGLSHIFGIDGVWLAYPITFSTILLLQMSFYLLVWRKRTIERLV